MTQPTPSLAKFLLARIAEDDARGRILAETRRNVWADDLWDGAVSPYPDSPSRIKADAEAKRRIVDAWRHESRGRDEIPARTPVAGALFWVMKQLAQPYADHPDFDPVWAV